MSGVATSFPPATPAPSASGRAWLWRLQQRLFNLLPLLVVGALALLSTWWLQQTELPAGPQVAVAPSQRPDFEMQGFELQRYGADGEAQAWLRGSSLRHYPHTDHLHIEGLRLQLRDPQGRWLLAEADEAQGPRAGNTLSLRGGVRVRRYAPGVLPEQGEAELVLRSQALTVALDVQRLHSPGPAVIESGRVHSQVASFRFDHRAGVLQFGGPARLEGRPVKLRP